MIQWNAGRMVLMRGLNDPIWRIKTRKVMHMSVSYNGLWKILIDNGMIKKDLISKLSISSATVAKMGRGEMVSMDVMERICSYFGCNIGDIMSFEKNAKDENK